MLQLNGQSVKLGTRTSAAENPPSRTVAQEDLNQIDCILMDRRMSVCDGLTATKRIREIETKHGTVRHVIIGMAAVDQEGSEQLREAMDAGMDDVVLKKTFRAAELLASIDEIVRLKDTEHEGT